MNYVQINSQYFRKKQVKFARKVAKIIKDGELLDIIN